MRPRLLIVNADDFGIHEDVNRGILDAFRHGAVRSASIMANMPAFDHAVVLAAGAPGLEIGLHLNVTSGPAVAPTRLIPLLADDAGLFRFAEHDIPTSMRLYRATAERSTALAEQLVIEGEHQLERLHRRGLAPAHLTIHHYLSLLHPRLFDAYLRLAEAARLPCRALSRPIIDVFGGPAEDQRAMSDRAAAATVPTPDVSVSNLLDGTSERPPADAYREQMLGQLATLCRQPDVASIELVTHPVVVTPVVRALDTTYLWARELETALVTDERFLSTIASLGLIPGGYQQLAMAN